MKNITLLKIFPIFIFPFIFCSASVAQTILDTTLGNESSVVTPDVAINGINSDRIDGGAVRGTNLFHSFQEFNVEAGRGAYFTNPDGVSNIFSRVTGTSPSNINGTLGVLGNANLFFLNPNGIIFGANASLNLNGSFVATTANAIRFGNQGIFSASVSDIPSVLTVNPSAFLFNQIAKSITNQSTTGLAVSHGKSLLLVGGDVNLEGGMLAPSGRVELGGLADSGTVELSFNGSDLGLSFPNEARLADVSLASGADVNVVADGLGRIAINAQNLSMTGGSTLQAGTYSMGSIDSTAGNIEIHATGAINLTGASTIANTVLPGTVGNGGSINISTGSLSAANGSQLTAITYGQGDAGSVNINARDTVSFDGAGGNGYFSGGLNTTNIFTGVFPTAVGDSGSINITARSLSFTNGAGLYTTTLGQGNAGTVNINARDTVYFDGVARSVIPSGIYSTVAWGAVGNGGDINITTGSLSVTNGASLGASTGGQGNAGSVNINAQQTVSFDGTGSNTYPSAALSSVESRGVGRGGDIKIVTDSLSLGNGAVLVARTRGEGDAGNITINANTLSAVNGGEVLTTSFSSGKAGNITVNARERLTLKKRDRTYDARNAFQLAVFGEELSLNGASSASGLFANTSKNSTGQGGSLIIHAGQLIVQDGAEVNASSQGTGNAGELQITANSILTDHASIKATTTSGEGGNISLQAKNLQLRHDSAITATAGGSGNGGNLSIDTGTLVALEDSDITADAFLGMGGNITISTQGLFRSAESEITASSQQGISGAVEVQNLGLDQQHALEAPESNLVSTQQVVAGSCLARSNAKHGVFTVTGNGGLPETPYEAIALPYELVQIQPVTSQKSPVARQFRHSTPATSSDGKPGNPIQPATELMMTADGRTLLVAASTAPAVANPENLICSEYQTQSMTESNREWDK